MQKKCCAAVKSCIEIALLDMVETGRPYLAPLQNVCEGAHDRVRLL